MVKVPREVARRIGYYVYLYVDPRNGRPFYVGKGKGSRVLGHLNAVGPGQKATIIRQLRRAGLKPRIDILARRIADEENALRIEAAAIDLLGLQKLTNLVRGWHSVELGRMPLRQLVAYYRPVSAWIKEPSLLIRINRLYSHGMSDSALYEATRGVWKVNPNRASGAKYALAVFDGIVREVYEILSWHPAGSTKYRTRPRREVHVPGRWEFVGRRAPESARRRYVDHSVSQNFRRGLQSPVVYVNI